MAVSQCSVSLSRAGATGQQAVYWFLAGNVLYYTLGIGLAVVLKDNRAFYKYVYPVTVPFKLGSRFALLKVKGDAAKCSNCQACTKMCPMNIRIPAYTQNGQRVLSTECSLCQTCMTVCPRNALSPSFGLAVGGRELLRQRVDAPGWAEALHGKEVRV